MFKKFLLIGSGNFINEIRPALSRLVLEVEIANTFREIPSGLKKRGIDLVLLDSDSVKTACPLLRKSKINFIVLSRKRSVSAVLQAKNAGAADYILKPFNARELNLRLNAALNGNVRVSCIGGGTGLFNVLMGLKNIAGVLSSSIVSMTDDGGSSGRLRESFGTLPPGDVRRSLVALSNAPEIMNEIMTYRFDKGGCLAGHNLGNLLITALARIKGSMPDAVSGLGDILNIQGIVRPVSVTKSKLCALFEDGTVIRGESRIDLGKGRSPDISIKKCWHEPGSEVEIGAYSTIINSDFVVLGPGDLFTSVITNLLVSGVRQAIIKTRAKKIYICNLMTKPGETANFDALDHITEILKYLKGDYLDYVILSDHNRLSVNSVSRYSRKHQYPVKAGDVRAIRKATKAKIIVADVAHETELVRHDSCKIKEVISQIIKKEGA